MGVQGLWELLAPVGRRVSVETLSGKKLAIDASIWMIQFMKAMRDEKGEMVRNAHLIGFFRRICKLLFLRTKPVFVFDGGTPALKRRTVIARRRQRENAQAKIRKTAEKLLLNHLKAMKLKELAENLESQTQNKDLKGKRILSDQTEAYADAGSYNQEALDELLAASLAAEEDGSLTSKASTSFCGNSPEEAHDSDDEEMILPVMHGKLDPAVLAALPPSMQLDLLVQMRERLMAENRQKYQKVKKAPAEFSELQIQAYLKTVAFRREIDEVQKSAAGRGVGGVQTSRIASEANREFIFSSSFTGDKEILASSGADKNGDAQQCQSLQNEPSSDSFNCITSTVHSNLATVSGIDETRRDFDDGVETYLDERGRVRVSRLRAMGIRMTQDLQMNLDLMKEINQVKIKENTDLDTDAIFNKEELGGFLGNNQFLETSGGDKGEHEIMSSNNRMNMSLQSENDQTNEYSIFRNGSTMEISFIEDESGQKDADGEEDLFAHLVAGNSEMVFPSENSPGKRLSTHASDCDLEEKIMEGKSDGFCDDGNRENQPSIAGSNVSDGSEVEWEEGVCDVIGHASPCPPDTEKSVSIGCLEEEADLQEAIRRSLEDSEGNKSIGMSSENENFSISREMVYRDTTTGFTHQASNLEKYKFGTPNNTLFELLAGDENMDTIGITQKISGSPERLLASSMANDTMEVLIDKPSEGCTVSASGCLRDNTSKYDTVETETSHLELVPPIDAKEVNLGNQCLDISNEDGEVSGISISSSGVAPISAAVMTDMLDSALVDAHHQKNNEALATSLSNKTSYHDISCEKYTTKEAFDTEIEQTPDRGKTCDIFSEEREHMGKFEMKDNMEVQVEESEALLKEEMLNLSQERVTLGYERRKLERNAESVSSEMFAECQELLQMFGLPYIIAPMEAEAQCAYMEIAGLVDGVVTDDSDVFLFGARSVYKNIFDDRKYVETYFLKDIESELGLTREKLIRMAMLLGSDYTEGVSGIGIVNAIEVVNAFPEENGLQRFREWLESPDPSILGKLDVQTGSSRKRGSKVGKDDLNTGGSGCDGNVFECHDDIPNVKQIFMEKHRNVSKNWHIPSSFPSETVISAYTSPQVDKSTEPFSWGKPDLFMLRRLCWEKFGWGNQKADELLVPVLKEYNKHETQLRLESFYTFNERFAKIRSHRIKKAVKGIAGKRSLELMDDLPEEVSGAKERRMLSPCRTEKNKLESPLFGKSSQAGNEMSVSEKATPNFLRSLRKKKKHVPSEMGDSEPSIPEKGGQKIKRDSVEHVRVRGRGRGRGKAVGRGRTKYPQSTEISSNDDNNDSDDLKIDVGKTEEFYKVRRSTRPRKPVNYMVNDEEFDGMSEILDPSAGKGANGGTAQEEFSCEKEMFQDADLGFSEQNRPSDGNPSIVDGDDEDFLELGGGFCIDGEQEHGTVSVVPSVSRGATYHSSNASFEAELSSDYLKDGGGFCLDEGEPDTHPVQYVSTFASPSGHDSGNPSHPSMEAVSGECLKTGEFQIDEHEVDDGSIQSICCQRPHDGLSKRKDNVDMERSVHCSNDRDDNDPTSTGGLLQDNPPELGEDDSVASSTRLAAMPFLRRKRKKS